MAFCDRFSGDELWDEEFLSSGRRFPLSDGEDVSDDGAGELGGIRKIMAGLGEDVLKPGFGGDGDEGKVAWDGTLLLGHPRYDGEGVSGAGGDDGGGWAF